MRLSRLRNLAVGFLSVFVVSACSTKTTNGSSAEKVLCQFYNGTNRLYSTSVSKGTDVVYKGSTPVKTGDAEGTYAFTGWDKPLTNIQAATDFYAQFEYSKKTFVVTFLNYDGKTIETQEVEINKYATAPANPTYTNPNESYLVYTFTGWDKDPTTTPITKATSFTAQYKLSYQSYEVTFVSEGQAIKTTQVVYGQHATYDGSTPTKAEDEHYTYLFSDWSPKLSETLIRGATTFTATFTSYPKTFTMSFYSEPGVLFTTAQAYYGRTMTKAWVDSLGKPSKDPTATTSYAFSGWDPDPTTEIVYGPLSFMAQYTESTRLYSVSFVYLAEDNTTVTLDRLSVSYNGYASYKGPTPTKTSQTGQYTYVFTGWDKDLATTPITADTVFTAQFSRTVNQFTITFLDDDGSPLSSQKWDWGSTPTCDTPTKTSEQYDYTFAGWSPAVETVTKDATYTATYTSAVKTFTVTYKNDSGALLGTASVKYGEDSTFSLIPTKNSPSSLYHYVFAGWSPSDKAVKSDLVCVATFEMVVDPDTVAIGTAGTEYYGAYMWELPSSYPIGTDWTNYLSCAKPSSAKMAYCSGYNITVSVSVLQYTSSSSGPFFSGQGFAFYDSTERVNNTTTPAYFTSSFATVQTAAGSSSYTAVSGTTSSAVSTLPTGDFDLYLTVLSSTATADAHPTDYAWKYKNLNVTYSYLADPSKASA